MSRRAVGVGVVLAAQAALVGVAVGPQLSARTTGTDYRFRVSQVDPVDPFRGTYVDLDYPDLALPDHELPDDEPPDAPFYLALEERDGVMVAGSVSTRRPSESPYLRCTGVDRCGIESFFVAQDEAEAFGRLVGSGTAVARVRIDGRGNAALMDVEPG